MLIKGSYSGRVSKQYKRPKTLPVVVVKPSGARIDSGHTVNTLQVLRKLGSRTLRPSD